MSYFDDQEKECTHLTDTFEMDENGAWYCPICKQPPTDQRIDGHKLYMKNIRIINTTTGSEVQGYWETEEQAWEFIEEQSNPLEYKIMED